VSDIQEFRTGNKNKRNIYLLADGEERHVGCMFTEVDGILAVRALNHYADVLHVNDVVGAQSPRAQERCRRYSEAMRRAEQVWKSVACQNPSWVAHEKCLGLRASMNNDLGCLCDCHDGEAPAMDTEAKEASA
jgi:hypothetical protein